MTGYPQWTSAGPDDMRVEVEFNRFVDYARHSAGVWRQKTRPMTNKESVTPGRHWLGSGPDSWPVVDEQMAAWLETTHRQVRQ